MRGQLMGTRGMYRGSLAWPFRLIGWFLLALVVLGVIAVIAVVGSGIYYEVSRSKAGEVEDLIDRHVPLASSTDQIFTFLDSQGIEHGQVEAFDPENPALRDYGLTPGTNTISAVIRNDGYSLALVDIEITFILDERGLFKEALVREVDR